MGREFLVRADGGARGNPGAAAFGAVVYENGKVIKEILETIGIASNNVAEYRGLIAGLNAVHSLDPNGHILVEMDSKLVIEQMSGNWKIKHPDMRTLAKQAPDIHDPKLIKYKWIIAVDGYRPIHIQKTRLKESLSALAMRETLS